MKECPKCGGEVFHHTVNVGVGIIEGPWGCVDCGWSESEEYDLSGGRSAIDEKGGVMDQFGAYYPAENSVAIAYRMAEAVGLKELDVVRLWKDEVLNGTQIPANAQGTIVHCWQNGLIEVEFSDPQVVVALSRYSVKLVKSYDVPNNTQEVDR